VGSGWLFRNRFTGANASSTNGIAEVQSLSHARLTVTDLDGVSTTSSRQITVYPASSNSVSVEGGSDQPPVSGAEFKRGLWLPDNRARSPQSHHFRFGTFGMRRQPPPHSRAHSMRRSEPISGWIDDLMQPRANIGRSVQDVAFPGPVADGDVELSMAQNGVTLLRR